MFYEYSGITLGNSDDELILTDGGLVEQAAIAWDGGPVWPDPDGSSMQWTGIGDNNDGATWADSGSRLRFAVTAVRPAWPTTWSARFPARV